KNEPVKEECYFQRTNKSIGRSTSTLVYTPDQKGILKYMPNEAIKELEPNAIAIVEQYHRTHKQFKITATAEMIYIKPERNDLSRDERLLVTPMYGIKASMNINEIRTQVKSMMNALSNASTEKHLKSSGYMIFGVTRITFSITPLNVTLGSSYIPLSGKIKNMTKSILNIENDDNKCFYYSMYAYFNIQSSKENDKKVRYDFKRIKTYISKNPSLINFDSVEFPTPLSNDVFRTIEANNQNIALKVYYFRHEDANDVDARLMLEYYDDDIYLTRPDQIILLYLDPEHNPLLNNEKRETGHYCLV
ncbi:MAG: hypothetical protein ACK559_27705, partial [bacterium]